MYSPRYYIMGSLMFAFCGDFAEGYGYISPFIDIQCTICKGHWRCGLLKICFSRSEFVWPSFEALDLLGVKLKHVFCHVDFENIVRFSMLNLSFILHIFTLSYLNIWVELSSYVHLVEVKIILHKCSLWCLWQISRMGQ